MKKKFFYVNTGPTAATIIASSKTSLTVRFILESRGKYFATEVTVSSYLQEEGSVTSFKEVVLSIESSESPDLTKGMTISGRYNSIVGIGTFKF
jgi:hypothetical protein